MLRRTLKWCQLAFLVGALSVTSLPAQQKAAPSTTKAKSTRVRTSDRSRMQQLAREGERLLKAGETTPIEKLMEGLKQPRAAVKFNAPRTSPLPAAELYRRARKSVVVLSSLYYCTKCTRLHATVAGGVVVGNSGEVLTNAHVVDDLSRVRVMTRTGTLPAWVVHRDTSNDLALLKVTGSFKSLPVISSSRLREGNKVFTFGHPNPDIQGLDPVHTAGDIIRLAGVGDDPRTLQISAAIQPGNSGGPLVNEHGNVVGVVVARAGALKLLAKNATLPQNVNYAVRSTRLLLLLEEHIPKAGEKLKEISPRTARDPAKVRDEVSQATVLILVDRGR